MQNKVSEEKYLDLQVGDSNRGFDFSPSGTMKLPNYYLFNDESICPVIISFGSIKNAFDIQ